MTHPAMAPASLQLRPISESDAEILFDIYASTRAEELAQVDWSAAQKESFLRQQFEAQRRYYVAEYTGANFQMITLDGQSAGRWYIQPRPDEIRIMDLALLPAFRGRGLGTALIMGLQEQGERTSRKVTLHVESFNPALRLYYRLGFHQVASSGVYHLLEWKPSGGVVDPPTPHAPLGL